MSKIITVHSYKGGTGKTSLSVNLAATFAKQGKKVALFDLDFRAPSLFAILKNEKTETTLNNYTLWINDYLNGTCKIDDTLADLSIRIEDTGKLYAGLANPSTEAMRDMATKDRRWEMHALNRLIALKKPLKQKQKIDYIIFDTSPGLHYSSMNALVTADIIILSTTNDCSDVNGTKRMLTDFYELFENKTTLVFNKVIEGTKIKTAEYAKDVKTNYKFPLLAIVPCFCEIAKAEGKHIFPQDKPNHPFTKILADIANNIEQNKLTNY